MALVLASCSVTGVGRGGAMKDYSALERAFTEQITTRGTVPAYAFYHGADNSHWAVAADGGSDALIVYDAVKGTELRRVGKPGTEKGELSDPVAIYIEDDLLFVLERGNDRIQVFELPNFTSFGFIGEDRLDKPEAMAAFHIEPGAFYIYVAETQLLPDGGKIGYIRRFSVSRAVNTIHSAYQFTFGFSPGVGYLGPITSLTVDQEGRQVAVTSEGTVSGDTRTYSLDGQYIGRGR